MKRIYSILTLILIVFINDLNAQDCLVIARKNRKYGFLDCNGKVKMNFTLDRVEGFNKEGNARAMINGKYGILKNDTKWLLEPKYDFIEPFVNNSAKVWENKNTYFFINSKGKKVEEPVFSGDNLSIEEKIAEEIKANNHQVIKYFKDEKNKLHGLFNLKSRDTVLVIPIINKNRYDISFDSINNVIISKTSNKSEIYDPLSKKLMISCDSNETIEFIHKKPFSKRFLVISKGDNKEESLFRIDSVSTAQTCTKYEGDFKSVFRTTDKSIWIKNSKGVFSLDANFKIENPDLPLHFVADQENGVKFVSIDSNDDIWGILDKDFKWLRKPERMDFVNYPLGGNFFKLSNGKIAYIDMQTGKNKIEPILDSIRRNYGSYGTTFFVYKGKEIALVSYEGDFIIPFGYDEIVYPNEVPDYIEYSIYGLYIEYFQARKGNTYYLFDRKGKIIYATQKHKIIKSLYQIGYLCQNLKNKKTFLLNPNFKPIKKICYDSVALVDESHFDCIKAFLKPSEKDKNRYFDIIENGKKLNKTPFDAKKYPSINFFSEKKLLTYGSFDSVGILTIEGKEIFSPKIKGYSNTGSLICNNLFYLVHDGKGYYMNKNGKVVFNYDENKTQGLDSMIITYTAWSFFRFGKNTIFIDTLNNQITVNNTRNSRFNVSKGRTLLITNLQDTIGTYNKNAGHSVLLINNTPELWNINMQDGTIIDMQTEAKDSSGIWKKIDYIQPSWCGNSYYSNKIKPFSAMKFAFPYFKGNFKTKMRIRFGNIISEEFDTQINYTQFWREEGAEIKKPSYLGYWE